jgi:hypothetical protein
MAMKQLLRSDEKHIQGGSMNPVWRPTIAGLLVLPIALTLPGLVSGKDGEKATRGILDIAGIERTIGKAGEAKGDVYKISLPRTDLQVTVDTVQVKPGLALGSWIAFSPPRMVP